MLFQFSPPFSQLCLYISKSHLTFILFTFLHFHNPRCKMVKKPVTLPGSIRDELWRTIPFMTSTRCTRKTSWRKRIRRNSVTSYFLVTSPRGYCCQSTHSWPIRSLLIGFSQRKIKLLSLMLLLTLCSIILSSNLLSIIEIFHWLWDKISNASIWSSLRTPSNRSFPLGPTCPLQQNISKKQSK